MRKIISTTYMTLDGDIANMQDWHTPYVDMTVAAELLQTCDALIMGRRTYEGFAPFWSAQDGADAFSDRMNAIRKYVVSTTLRNPTWNNTTVIQGDVATGVRALKAQPGSNILQYGFGPVTRLLLDNGLLDELRLWLHPVLSGRARPDDLLYRDAPRTTFSLADTSIRDSGVIILTYRPDVA